LQDEKARKSVARERENKQKGDAFFLLVENQAGDTRRLKIFRRSSVSLWVFTLFSSVTTAQAVTNMQAMWGVLFIYLLFIASAAATNYYVSNSGSDSNAGTSTSAPFKTLAHV
jgi:hypothetical protein